MEEGDSEAQKIVFGPVPSRRLGRSIGINNIPAKTCTYSCVYCQVGKTTKMTIAREAFYQPERIYSETKKQVETAQSNDETIDYLTFVPDGEPTLDINLQKEIDLVSKLGIPVAILTNSSLIWEEEVREALLNLDLVSLKVDAVREHVWKKIDRPHKSLVLDKILDGILRFSEDYKGKIITETMFIGGIDYSEETKRIADFLDRLSPSKAYVAIPTRPPACEWIVPATEEAINRAYLSFSEVIGSDRVELLIGYEGNEFSSTGDLEEDLLSITAVHPMRKDAVKELLDKTGHDWGYINRLIVRKKIIKLVYGDEVYYMRRLPSRKE